MSGPFNVGDVVIRIGGSPDMPIGTIVRISGLAETGKCRTRKCGKCQGLFFDKFDCGVYAGWAAHNFKSLPKADEQFTAQIRACKPIRKGVPA